MEKLGNTGVNFIQFMFSSYRKVTGKNRKNNMR